FSSAGLLRLPLSTGLPYTTLFRSGLRGLVGAGEVCLPESMRAEQLTDPIAFHGEGPVWSPSWGGLRWVDMLAGDILTLRRDRVERRHVGDVAAAVRPRSRGGAVIGREGRCHARGRDR